MPGPERSRRFRRCVPKGMFLNVKAPASCPRAPRYHGRLHRDAPRAARPATTAQGLAARPPRRVHGEPRSPNPCGAGSPETVSPRCQPSHRRPMCGCGCGRGCAAEREAARQRGRRAAYIPSGAGMRGGGAVAVAALVVVGRSRGTEPWASRGSPAGRLSDAPASLTSRNLSLRLRLRLRLSLSLRRRASPAATYVSSASTSAAAPARVPGGFRRAALGSLLSQIPGAQSRWPPVRAKPGCRLPAANMLSVCAAALREPGSESPAAALAIYPSASSDSRCVVSAEESAPQAGDKQSETARSGASRRRGAPVGGGRRAGGGLRCAGCGVRFVCSCSTARRQAAIYSRALTFHRDPSARP